MVVAGSIATGSTAAAGAWPERPITLVVPYPPGGGNDATARTVGPAWAKGLGQPVVIDNRGGAGGTIGSAAVAKAAADGYTLLLCSTGNLAVAPAVYRRLSYGAKSFAPVGQIVFTPNVWLTSARNPAADLRGFVALARSKPGAYSYASSGNGSTPHLATEALKAKFGLDILHVPYKGSSPAYNDLVSGRVDLMLDSAISAAPYLASSRVKALAVSTARRLPSLPGVPTLAEQRMAELALPGWVGVCAPAGTPAAVVDRLSSTLRAAVASPEVRDALLRQVAEPVDSTPAAFDALIARETDVWKRIALASKTALD